MPLSSLSKLSQESRVVSPVATDTEVHFSVAAKGCGCPLLQMTTPPAAAAGAANSVTRITVTERVTGDILRVTVTRTTSSARGAHSTVTLVDVTNLKVTLVD